MIIHRKLFIALGVILALIATPGFTLVNHIDANSFDHEADYMGQMVAVLQEDTSQYAVAVAEAYELLRNAKIEQMGLDVPQTSYFSQYQTAFEMLSAMYYDTGAYDPDIDYMNLMIQAAQDGSDYAMTMGRIYEGVRNNKISTLSLDTEPTEYFTVYSTGEDILNAMFPPEPVYTGFVYTNDDLYYLSRIVYLECGSTFISDWHQVLTATVVLNRVMSPEFPNTVYSVVYQAGQYQPVGKIHSTTPDQRTINNCIYALEKYGSPMEEYAGAKIPSSVVFQSESTQGSGVYTSIYVPKLGSTTYFCYSSHMKYY